MTGDLELPWPPKELTPNFKRRKHWTVYRPFAQWYRRECAWLTKKHLIVNGLASAPAGLRIASVTFYPPDRRKRDDDGMIGAFKAGRDGVADALGVDDHSFRPSYNFAEPVKNGRVVIVLGEE
jgi:crossover junction endodeoxyribonuclease RusA